MKFIHAADLHLDSPLRGLERYEGSPTSQLRGATRQALKNLVQLALDESVDFILIAGDIYDGDWRDYNTGLFFVGQMSRLREAGIPVFLIRGNHDAASHISKELKLPDNVREFPSGKPKTLRLESINVAIHGQSFASKAMTDDLSVHYPSAEHGLFNIGLLHTSASGREGHETYAPCNVQNLISKGYDYWALGHVHTREVLNEDPWIVFPGNLQGRHIREAGDKGCTVVSVENDRIQSVDHYPLDVVRWRECTVDVTDALDLDDLLDRVRFSLHSEYENAGGRLLAARIILHGACRAHNALSDQYERFVGECRALANDLVAEQIWVEKVKIQTRSQIDIGEMIERSDTMGDLLRFIRNLAADETQSRELFVQFRDLRQKLPLEIREGAEAIDFNDPTLTRDLLTDAEQILLPRLLNQEKTR